MTSKGIIFCCVTIFLNAHAVQYHQPYAPYYSQIGQDKYLNEQLFHNKKHGVFVDIGAHDGISYSNSYYFEKKLGWKGICVEPHPDRYKELVKNRKAACVQACIANANGKARFCKITGPLEMLSGLIDEYDPRHLIRIDQDLSTHGGSKQIISVDVFTLKFVLDKYKIKKIDFMSVDTEGSEFPILQSIDLNKIYIGVIVVENNYQDNKVKNYLLSKGYELIKKIEYDDVYKKKNYNPRQK